MSADRHASAWVLATGGLLTVLYGLQLSELVSTLATVLVGLGSCAVHLVALRVNRPAFRAPWWFMLASGVAFLGGIVLRPWAAAQTGFAALSGDLFSVSGYLLLVISLSLLLGRRGLVSHALTDGAIVCLGAGLLSLEFLALPAAQIATARSSSPSWPACIPCATCCSCC